MSLVNAFLGRHLELFRKQRVLVAGEWDSDYLAWLQPVASRVRGFTTHYPYAQQHDLEGEYIQVGAAYVPDGELVDVLLVSMPKSKAFCRYLLAMLLPQLKLGGMVYLVGESRSGVNSAPNLVKPYGRMRKLDSAKHCVLFGGELVEAVPAFDAAAWYDTYDIAPSEQGVQIHSLPGVFSADRLDEGTALLLAHLPVLAGRVLEVGCGAGVLGAGILQHYPQIDLTLVDVDALALASTARTLAANGLTATVCASDVYAGVAGKFSHIISNPPFHAGANVCYGATERLIAQARHYITAGGTLTLVVNTFLPYKPLLLAQFARVDVLAQTTKFIVYHCR